MLQHSLSILNSQFGKITTDQLASKACLSRRQYERLFMNHIGISPKKFLRTIRFQHALYRKQIEPNIPLTELAYVCSYFDQSHMINEFKSLSGLSPKQFFSSCPAYSDYFE